MVVSVPVTGLMDLDLAADDEVTARGLVVDRTNTFGITLILTGTCGQTVSLVACWQSGASRSTIQSQCTSANTL